MRRERLTSAYNRGFRAYSLTHRACTDGSQEASTRLAGEGERLSRGAGRPLWWMTVTWRIGHIWTNCVFSKILAVTLTFLKRPVASPRGTAAYDLLASQSSRSGPNRRRSVRQFRPRRRVPCLHVHPLRRPAARSAARRRPQRRAPRRLWLCRGRLHRGAAGRARSAMRSPMPRSSPPSARWSRPMARRPPPSSPRRCRRRCAAAPSPAARGTRAAVFLWKRAVIPGRGEAASPEPMTTRLIPENAAVGPLSQ